MRAATEFAPLAFEGDAEVTVADCSGLLTIFFDVASFIIGCTSGAGAFSFFFATYAAAAAS